jgi:metal-responsive CopG/Arc/MetJ family transcriptional regulator
MKIAISIPAEVFRTAEKLARRGRKSRSQVFSEAMIEYAARHDDDRITESWNAVLADVGDEPEEWVTEVSRRTLERSEW